MKKFFLTVGLGCVLSAFVVACGVAATPTPAPNATPTPDPLLDEFARLLAENACVRDALILYKLIDYLIDDDLSAHEEGLSAMEHMERFLGANASPDTYEAIGRWGVWLSENRHHGGFAAPLASCFDPIVEGEEMVF